MGKEAKIGLTVILVLLIVFGVVLARRLSGPAQGPQADSSQAAEVSKPDADAADPDRRTKDLAAASTKTTVVAAKPASSKTAKVPSAPVSKWNLVADGGKAADATSPQMPKASPPSLMPNPPMLTSAAPYDRRADSHQVVQAAETWQDGSAEGSGASGAGRAYDPFAVPTRSSPYRPGGSTAGRTPTYIPASRHTNQTAIQPSQQYAPSSGGGSAAGFGANALRPADGKYEVRPNDSYWIISQRLYGSGSYFKALAEHNRDKVPYENRLEVGEVISAPGIDELEKTYPGLCPKPSRRETVRGRASAVSTRSPYGGGRTYVVQEGDTLFDIARYELGKASRWVEIHELNRNLLGNDFDYLTPGIELALPGDGPIRDGPTGIITGRPGTGVYQR